MQKQEEACSTADSWPCSPFLWVLFLQYVKEDPCWGAAQWWSPGLACTGPGIPSTGGKREDDHPWCAKDFPQDSCVHLGKRTVAYITPHSIYRARAPCCHLKCLLAFNLFRSVSKQDLLTASVRFPGASWEKPVVLLWWQPRPALLVAGHGTVPTRTGPQCLGPGCTALVGTALSRVLNSGSLQALSLLQLFLLGAAPVCLAVWPSTLLPHPPARAQGQNPPLHTLLWTTLLCPPPPNKG